MSTPAASSRVLVDVEIARTRAHEAALPRAQLRTDVEAWLRDANTRLRPGRIPAQQLPSAISSRCTYVRCDVLDDDADDDAQLAATAAAWQRSVDGVAAADADVRILIYVLDEGEDDVEELDADEAAGDDAEAPVTAGNSCALPHIRFDSLWENLFYSPAEKLRVLSFAETALEMARAGVPAEVVNCNRIALLHGPPGTGKTTLCKAIAHKLSLRLSGVYPHCRLLEVNSHSLFSRWFSESGKLVQRLFESVRQQLEDDPKMFLCILIDEVESIASSRSKGGSDPQDAVRAGNAVLTQLDRLKRFPNVLVLCTSNLTQLIDEAFVDRVDIAQFVGPPNLEARYEILRSQVEALLTPSASSPSMLLNDSGAVLPLLSYRQLRGALAFQQRAASAGASASITPLPAALAALAACVPVCSQLLNVAQQCDSAGGRLLRRVPMRCCSDFKLETRGRAARMTLSAFVQRLPLAIAQETAAAQRMQQQAGASAQPAAAAGGTLAQPPTVQGRSPLIYYIAQSLDGFVADRDNELGWLLQFGFDAFQQHYDVFYANVGAIIMGASTYRWLAARGDPWPYADRPVWVLTHKPLPEIKGAERIRTATSAAQVASEARAAAGERAVWLMGGGRTAAQFAGLGEIDQLRITIMPVTLGDGARLLPQLAGPGQRWQLTGTTPFKGGAIELAYRAIAEPQATTAASGTAKPTAAADVHMQ